MDIPSRLRNRLGATMKRSMMASVFLSRTLLGLGMPASGKSRHFVYVANSGSDNVSAYVVDGDGALAPVTGSPFAVGREPLGVAVDPVDRFLYVTNFQGECLSVHHQSRHRRSGAGSRFAFCRRWRTSWRGSGPFGQICLCSEPEFE